MIYVIFSGVGGVIAGAFIEYFLNRRHEKDLSRRGLQASIISLINDLNIYKEKRDIETIRSIMRTSEILRYYAIAAMMTGVIGLKEFEELIISSKSSIEVVSTESFVIGQIEDIQKKLFSIENKLRDC